MRRIVSLKKPMNDREFATGQSAKECGKITHWKKPMNDREFGPGQSAKKCGKIKHWKKKQRNTEDPPQICLQISGQKSEKKPKKLRD